MGIAVLVNAGMLQKTAGGNESECHRHRTGIRSWLQPIPQPGFSEILCNDTDRIPESLVEGPPYAISGSWGVFRLDPKGRKLDSEIRIRGRVANLFVVSVKSSMAEVRKRSFSALEHRGATEFSRPDAGIFQEAALL